MRKQYVSVRFVTRTGLTDVTLLQGIAYPAGLRLNRPKQVCRTRGLQSEFGSQNKRSLLAVVEER